MRRVGQATITLEGLAKCLGLPPRHMIVEALQYPEDRAARRIRLIVSGAEMPPCPLGETPEEIQLELDTVA